MPNLKVGFLIYNNMAKKHPTMDMELIAYLEYCELEEYKKSKQFKEFMFDKYQIEYD